LKEIGAKKRHLSTIFAPASAKTQVISQFLTHAVRKFRLGAISEIGLSENWLFTPKAGLLPLESLINCIFRKDSALSKHFADPEIIGYH
jgi:hypothetical protein